MNLIEILRGREGCELWSPMLGECIFSGINGDFLCFKNHVLRTTMYLHNDGKFDDNGEVMIFPSENHRDWSLFNTIEVKPLLPYNPNIDEKTAMQESLKIWAWLKDTGLYKNRHPEWKIILMYSESCPLCSVFASFYCNGCPLCVLTLACCCENGSLYRRWTKTDHAGDIASKLAATAIYNKIASEYKRRYNEEFNPYE